MLVESQFRKKRWVLLLLILAVTTLCAFNLKNIRVASNFENLFDSEDEETIYFNHFREQFQPENDHFLLVIKSNKGIFNSAFLRATHELTEELSQLEHVVKVTSITNQNEVKFSAFNIPVNVPYLNQYGELFSLDSTKVYGHQELVKTLVSDDAKSICVLIKYQDFLPKEPTQFLITEVEKIVQNSPINNYSIFGKAYGQYYITAAMQRDMSLFFGLGMGGVFLLLLFTFRSVWGILVPQLIIILSLVWLMGGLGIFDTPINLLLTAMPILMLVVAMSDVIHLVYRYLDLNKQAPTAYLALIQAIKEVGLATFLTSITTAVGFYALCFITIRPIQTFGVVMGTGVLITFVLTFGLLPILFYWFPGPQLKESRKKTSRWNFKMKQLFVFTFRHQKLIGWSAVGVILISALGASRLSANNYSMPDLNPNDPFAKDMAYIDEHYGGVRSFVLTATLKDTTSSFNDFDVLRELEQIQNYLQTGYGVTVSSSLITAYKLMNRAKKEQFKLPKKRRDIKQFYNYLKNIGDQKLIYKFVNKSEKTAQIKGFINDFGSKAVFQKNKELFTFIKTNNLNQLDYKLTGTAHLVDKNVQFLVKNMGYGLAISIVIVALLIGFIFKSTVVPLISLVPNLIPIIIVGAVMGFLGIELKLATVIIFSIAFGIVVDDTIHFLGKFKYELAQGKTKLKAIEKCYTTTGKAMILTTLTLCIGFGIMCFSNFAGTFQLGVLLTLALLSALITDLLLLPLLLYRFYKA